MKTYCVVSYPATAAQYEQAIEEESTVRVSLDDQYCILKWIGATPPAFSGFPIMTHAEALELMQTAEWQDDAPPGGTDTPDDVDLESLTVTELKALARDAGIAGYSSMRKSELIAALSE